MNQKGSQIPNAMKNEENQKEEEEEARSQAAEIMGYAFC